MQLHFFVKQMLNVLHFTPLKIDNLEKIVPINLGSDIVKIYSN